MPNSGNYSLTFDNDHHLAEIIIEHEETLRGDEIISLRRMKDGSFNLTTTIDDEPVKGAPVVHKTLQEALEYVSLAFFKDDSPNEIHVMQTDGSSQVAYALEDDMPGNTAVAKFTALLQALRSGAGVEKLSTNGKKLAAEFEKDSVDGIDKDEFKRLLRMAKDLKLDILLPHDNEWESPNAFNALITDELHVPVLVKSKMKLEDETPLIKH